MEKSPEAFRTISEVAGDLELPQHVLRFWETKFTQIRPLKRAGGRRYYRPDDVELLRGIRHLLYSEGYTIRGVQRILRESGARRVAAIGRGGPEAAAALAAVPRDDDATPMFEFEDDDEMAAPPQTEEAPRAEPEATAAPPAPRRPTAAQEVDPDVPLPRDIRPDDEPDHRASPFRFLERLKGDGGGEQGRLSREDVRHLQATLFELIECKRLLDQAR